MFSIKKISIGGSGEGILGLSSPYYGKRLNRFRRGVTLIELLFVALIMGFIASAALLILKNTAIHENRQRETVDQVQNLRAAFYKVARDVRMAGNGLLMLGADRVQVYVEPDSLNDGTGTAPGWFRYKDAADYGVRAIYGTNGGNLPADADTLTIFRTDADSVAPMAHLRSDFTPGTTSKISLMESLARDTDISDGNIVALVSGPTVLIIEAKIGSLAPTFNELDVGDRFRPGAAMEQPAGFVFKAGSEVYNLKDVTFVTYYLDKSNLRLMANYHDAAIDDKDPGTGSSTKFVAVANNIEDFQVAYFNVRNGDPIPGPPSFNTGDPLPFGIRLGMVSRSASSIYDLDGLGNATIGKPVEILGHTGGTDSGFARRVMIEDISIRSAVSD